MPRFGSPASATQTLRLPSFPSTNLSLTPSLALSSLNKHAEAVAYYRKALELDPENETYKSNLKIAELKLREAPSPVSAAGVLGTFLPTSTRQSA